MEPNSHIEDQIERKRYLVNPAMRLQRKELIHQSDTVIV